jgi:hypothetical protein
LPFQVHTTGQEAVFAYQYDEIAVIDLDGRDPTISVAVLKKEMPPAVAFALRCIFEQRSRIFSALAIPTAILPSLGLCIGVDSDSHSR